MMGTAKYMIDSSGERFIIENFTNLACPKCGNNRLRYNGKWFCVGWIDEEQRVSCDWSQWKDRNRQRLAAFAEAEAVWALEHEQMSH